jgi:hypothetical protein
MTEYRIYLLEQSGSFAKVHSVACLTDDAALEAARPFLADWPFVEIWQNSRLVRGLPHLNERSL